MHYDSPESLNVRKSLPRPWQLADPGTRTFISLICHYYSLLFAALIDSIMALKWVYGTERCAKSSGLTIISYLFFFFFLLLLLPYLVDCEVA